MILDWDFSCIQVKGEMEVGERKSNPHSWKWLKSVMMQTFLQLQKTEEEFYSTLEKMTTNLTPPHPQIWKLLEVPLEGDKRIRIDP